MERHVGAPLFERTSRRVRLTPIGDRLREGLRPSYDGLLASLAAARAAARSPAGELRIGCTLTTAGPELDRLVVAFEQANPDCAVTTQEISIWDPISPLRDGTIDASVAWLVVDEPDLTAGPVIAYFPRVLIMAANHPLAAHKHVSAEVLADFPVPGVPATGVSMAIRLAMVPERTPSGRAVLVSAASTQTVAETVSLIARGHAVHPTVASTVRLLAREDIVSRPIIDLPPLPLGLIWCTAHENARILAFAEAARRQRPPYVDPSHP